MGISATKSAGLNSPKRDLDENLNAIGYIRVSKQEQVRDGLSLETQRDRIKHYCKSRGWTLVTIFEDRGISASKNVNRPGFNKVMSMVENKTCDVVIVNDYTRFHRKLVQFTHYYNKLIENNVLFADIRNPSMSTEGPTGSFMRDIMVRIGQLESEMIGERIGDVFEGKIDKGEYTGGHAPLGYEQVRKIETDNKGSKVKVVYPYFEKSKEDKDRESIRQIWTLAKKGTPIKEIARLTGVKWSTVAKILKNPTYIGVFCYNNKRRGTVLTEGPFDGYISLDHFNKVQRLLAFKNNRMKNKDIIPVKQITKTSKGYGLITKDFINPNKVVISLS